MRQTPTISTLKPYLALLTVYIVWGTTFAAIHIGVETIPPLFFACLRFLLAGSFLLCICLLRKEKLPDLKTLKQHFIVGVLMYYGGQTLIYCALKDIPTGLAASINATSPFWALWFASILPPKEKIPWISILGILLGFMGMMILLSPQLNQTYHVSPVFWWSVVFMLLTGVFGSAGAIYFRKRNFTNSLLMGVALQCIFAGLLLLPTSLLTIHPFIFKPSMGSIWALIYLILVATTGAMTCYLYILHRLPVPLICTIAYVTPLITIFFGWLFFHEAVTLTTMTGTIIILVGVVLVQWVQPRRTSLQTTEV